MKEKLKKAPVLEKWFYTQSPLVITRPAIRETGVCLTYLCGAFLLSCGKLGGQCAPFALGLLASAGGGLRGLCALIGASVGFLTMQPFAQGLEMASAAILIFVTMYIFGTLWVTKQPWFRCLVPGVMEAAVGGIFLFSRELTMPVLLGYGQGFLLAGLSPLAFDCLFGVQRQNVGSLLALCFFVIGGAQVPMPLEMNLGVVGAVMLSAAAVRKGEYGIAGAMGAAMGAALDVSLGSAGLWTLTIAMGALVSCCVPRELGGLRFVVFPAAVLAMGMVTEMFSLKWILSPAVGAALSLLIPAEMVAGREESAIAQSAALVEQRLTDGFTALKSLYDAIGIDPEETQNQERQQIFDKAATKVCRRCTRYSQCWEKNSSETYQSLRMALTAILSRGEARREDFPEGFSRECRHLEGLVTALNQELDGIVYRKQSRSRNQENRLIVSRSLLHMSRMLEENARQLRCDQRFPQEAYTIRVGVSARSRRGMKASGDRGLCFHTDDGKVYTILCDGSGTGPEAGRESLLAVDTLAGLIQSGMGPGNAMEFLNSMYILRESAGFATMDVLELNLVTGQGTLYKWGAAPSYVKSGGVVKKVGTAAPPPGLGVGSTCGAEVIRLSLWGGDMLVLASDGVAGEAAEELIGSFEGDNVKELSAMLIERAEAMGGEDDMTAAVLRLEEINTHR